MHAHLRPHAHGPRQYFLCYWAKCRIDAPHTFTTKPLKMFLEHFIHCRSVVDGTRAALFDDHLNSVPPRSSPSSIAVHDIPNLARAFFDYPAAIRAGAVHRKRLLPYNSARLCTLAENLLCASDTGPYKFVVCKRYRSI